MEEEKTNYIWGGCLIAFAIFLVMVLPYFNTLTENVRSGIAFVIFVWGAVLIIEGQMKGRKKLKEKRAKESL